MGRDVDKKLRGTPSNSVDALSISKENQAILSRRRVFVLRLVRAIHSLVHILRVRAMYTQIQQLPGVPPVPTV